jgi:hypothetical protein
MSVYGIDESKSLIEILSKEEAESKIAITTKDFTFQTIDKGITFNAKTVKLGSNLIYITITGTIPGGGIARTILTSPIVPSEYRPNEMVRTSIAGDNQLIIQSDGSISGHVVNTSDDSATITLHTTFIKY